MSEKWQVVRSSIIKQALYVEDVDTKDMVCLLPQGPEQADQRRAHRPALIAASPEMLALPGDHYRRCQRGCAAL